ncbi:MAG: hypothetical protein KKC75_05860 [Nanoarchaeota archaeon]|nr:hypothetical protein [Nanoarchaeota archaeon]MBU1004797.1 hypothetical protein [Nanoarchaeota archaeon]MBU1946485.1 hypothetical protein [Nanoarchaeota archaeon]
MLILGLIVIFLLSGCEQIKELYGIQSSGKEEYVPLEEIKVQGEVTQTPEVIADKTEEMPPALPKDEITEVPVEVKEEKTTELPPTPPQEEVPVVIEEKEESVAESTTTTKSKEGAKVLITKETDLISLKPKVTDPDKDKIVFTYSTPVSAEGKWQTKYGDAGEYTVTVTASDGQASTTRDVLIIVNKKEEAPTIDDAIPKETALDVKENTKLDFSIRASDLNNDPIKYSWNLDDKEVSKDKAYNYEVGYDAAGQHSVKIVVSDGEKDTSKVWSVKVQNVNRKPILDKIADVNVKETETITLSPKSTDPDSDPITIILSSDKFKKVDKTYEWKTTYDDAGEYTVTVTASDGTDSVSQAIKVTIGNVNRPPVIEDIVLG